MLQQLSDFDIRPMTRGDAEQIAAWHYDGPYAFYDLANDPEDLAELLAPAMWGREYFSVYDRTPVLIGFFQFTDAAGSVEVGLGLRPDLTGQGLGLPFLQAGLAFAQARFAPTRFRLAVATFNQRAIRVYTRAGFEPARTYCQATSGGICEFLEMVKFNVPERRG